MSWTEASMLEDWPGQMQGQSRLRGGASQGVQRLLRWAALLSFLRLAVLPWLVVFGTYHRQPELMREPMFFTSIGCGAIFLFASAIARTMAVSAVLIALAGFGLWTWYDLSRSADLIEAGIIGKSIIGLLLIYALMQSILSRTL
ncbi:MAG: hypothetical protein ACTHLN_00570 [Tepidisphaeraceae bacterium]